MFWSAASLVIVVASTSGPDLTERELRAWKSIQPSILTLVDGRVARGSAALISREGLFITHATALQGNMAQGVTSGGKKVLLRVLASDDPTQFVLLRAENWNEDQVPVTIGQGTPRDKGILAITPEGPIRAEFAGATYGIVNPSRRVVSMTEVRLENTLRSLSGSLLINLEGQLVGAVNATLGLTPEQTVQKTRADIESSRGSVGGGGIAGLSRTNNIQYGPGILTAAYTVNYKVFQRVVRGFLSEDHVVRHPAIGVFCRDALPSGALIDSVTKGSTAEKAGLKAGDVIYTIENRGVKNQIDFAQIMADQEIGEVLTIWIQRGGLRQPIRVEVGTQP